jgi:hypothetical protein
MVIQTRTFAFTPKGPKPWRSHAPSGARAAA